MTHPPELDFVHRFVRSSSAANGVTLLLLHGTGGDENDLLPIGQQLLPGAALLSPRGKVSENGMPRFFRRFAEGVFDLADMKVQTTALARFIDAAASHYQFERSKVVAVGYSNGANIAASLLLTESSALAGAALLRAMVPFVPTASPDLNAKPILIAAGKRDPIATPEQANALAHILQSAGANVSLHWGNTGHQLTSDDVAKTKTWLEASF